MSNIVQYEGVAERIQSVYASCSKSEQQLLIQILQEMSITGQSQTLEQLWLADFKEVPVSIDEFICDPYYLGGTNRNGSAVYPFWRETVRNIFNQGNKYSEIVLSGATRIGKTSTMTIIMAYMLYRLMLYRNPHEYFKKKEVSRFTIAFANLNMKLAEGVCYREFNDTLKDSPFFNEHGRFSRSDRNFYYIPEGDKIDIVAGSDATMFLGMQIWCLVGSTNILTAEGIKTLEECAGTVQTVFQYDGNDIHAVDAPVLATKYVKQTIRIELEDGSVIEGTPEHQVMLSDGTYKALKDLTSSDDLLTLNSYTEVDEMNLKDKDAKFIVYEHVCPAGKRYVGITSKQAHERWQVEGAGYKENAHFWAAIQKYGWDNFEHNILDVDLSLEQACKLECTLIREGDLMNPERGYNHTTGGNFSYPDNITRAKISAKLKERCSDPEYRKKMSENLKGHFVSEQTTRKISEANKGKKRSEEFCNKQQLRKPSPETIAKLRGRPSWCKGLTKETDERVARIAEKQRGKKMTAEQKALLSEVQKARFASGFSPVWINDGLVERCIQQGSDLPEGFHYGRLSVLDTYIFKGNESKKIRSADLPKYINEGWSKGRPSCIGESIRAANQKMHWEYLGTRFESANELAEHLQQNGYPKIVSSTITALWKKGFETSPNYKSLSGKIVRVDHEN